MLQRFIGSNFHLLLYHNTVFMLWLGLGTETKWLGLGKDCVLA